MLESRWITVRNEASGDFVCQRGAVASSFLSRMRGLLGQHGFTEHEYDGLLIRPSSAVHTLGMAFAIDVIAIDRSGRVVGLREDLRPCRAAFFNWRTHEVLELPAGRIARAAVHLGDQFRVVSA
jgi:uncharacterized membrane protein (UPF0127 family)